MNFFDNPSLRYVKDISHPSINNGQPVPLFEPVAPEGQPSLNTLTGWNAAADRRNRRAFARVFGREPVCGTELRTWENSYFSKDFRWEVAAQST